jgi:DNA (cytosine-5)-methyltransferase 1
MLCSIINSKETGTMVAATAVLNESLCLEPVERQATDELSCIEFFAGIGLTHLGLSAHGWKCIYANDIEAKKKQMYEACFGTADYYHVEDVWKTERILRRIPEHAAELATASFPCVDLSLAGNLKGLSGDQSGAFYGFVEVMKGLRDLGRLPKAVLVENVIGFLSSHDGKFFRVAIQQLSDLGYFLDAFVVDAKHFTPQSRPRLFIVGFQNTPIPTDRRCFLSQRSFFEHPGAQESAVRPVRLLENLNKTKLKTGWVPLFLPSLPPVNRRLHEYIDTDDSQDWWQESRVRKHLAEMHLRHVQRMRELRDAKHLSIGTIFRRVREGRSRSEIRTDGLAGCLRTPRGGSSKQIVFLAGEGKIRMRWMSPREYARLQGCPDYPITVDRNEALWGFGDAVCVPVISWIAESVLSQLFTSPSGVREPAQAIGD